MTNKDKIILLNSIKNNSHVDFYINALEQMGDMEYHYYDYLKEPISCDTELNRLKNADYKLCCVLLTMLIREDHFDNYAFEQRYENGWVTAIIERMIERLKVEGNGSN